MVMYFPDALMDTPWPGVAPLSNVTVYVGTPAVVPAVDPPVALVVVEPVVEVEEPPPLPPHPITSTKTPTTMPAAHRRRLQIEFI